MLVLEGSYAEASSSNHSDMPLIHHQRIMRTAEPVYDSYRRVLFLWMERSAGPVLWKHLWQVWTVTNVSNRLKERKVELECS